MDEPAESLSSLFDDEQLEKDNDLANQFDDFNKDLRQQINGTDFLLIGIVIGILGNFFVQFIFEITRGSVTLFGLIIPWYVLLGVLSGSGLVYIWKEYKDTRTALESFARMSANQSLELKRKIKEKRRLRAFLEPYFNKK